VNPIVGIWANPDKDNGFVVTHDLVAHLQGASLDVRLLGMLPEWMEHGVTQASQQLTREQLCGLDVVFVVGGDGTLLHCARQMLELATANEAERCDMVPLVGINMGRCGFLAELEVTQVEWAAQRLAAKAYDMDTVMTLEAILPDGQHKYGINDMSLIRVGPRIIHVQASQGLQIIDAYLADGLIVASPMGATGYSLSAGGPIVNPQMECLLLTPICAHTLHARSIVIDASETIELQADADAKLSVDGQVEYLIKAGETVYVRRSQQRLAFVRFSKRNFYALLRSKMSEWTQVQYDMSQEIGGSNEKNQT